MDGKGTRAKWVDKRGETVEEMKIRWCRLVGVAVNKDIWVRRNGGNQGNMDDVI